MARRKSRSFSKRSRTPASRIAVISAAALGLDADLAAAQQAGDARLHHVGGVAVRRPAEMCEQRRAADPALGLDVLQHAPRDDAAARGDVAPGVELEDAELAARNLGDGPRELGSSELQQLGRRDLRRDEVRDTDRAARGSPRVQSGLAKDCAVVLRRDAAGRGSRIGPAIHAAATASRSSPREVFGAVLLLLEQQLARGLSDSRRGLVLLDHRARPVRAPAPAARPGRCRRRPRRAGRGAPSRRCVRPRCSRSAPRATRNRKSTRTAASSRGRR